MLPERAGKNKCVNVTSSEAKYFFQVSPKHYFIDHNLTNISTPI